MMQGSRPHVAIAGTVYIVTGGSRDDVYADVVSLLRLMSGWHPADVCTPSLSDIVLVAD